MLISCIKCGKQTIDKTSVRAPAYQISLCREHRADVSADREVLNKNSQLRFNNHVDKDSKMSDELKVMMKKRVFNSTAFDVYSHYATKTEIKVLTQEDLDKEANPVVETKVVENETERLPEASE